MLAIRDAVEKRFNGMTDDKTKLNIIDGALPPGTARGYNRSTKTMNIPVDWKHGWSGGPIATGTNQNFAVFPKNFKEKLDKANDLGRINIPINNQTKSTYLGNMILHELGHIILDRNELRQLWGIRDHTKSGLMGGGLHGENMRFNDAGMSILNYDDGSKSAIRAALGHEWTPF